ncbi:MAG TPA: ferredoxin [Nonomuraea sp.]|nr:ferredoxin [Nonomuraea sp.]
MRIIADQSRCIGAGHCIRTAPDLFDADDDTGLVVVAEGELDPSRAGDVREAARLCPNAAIRLHDT